MAEIFLKGIFDRIFTRNKPDKGKEIERINVLLSQAGEVGGEFLAGLYIDPHLWVDRLERSRANIKDFADKSVARPLLAAHVINDAAETYFKEYGIDRLHSGKITKTELVYIQNYLMGIGSVMHMSINAFETIGQNGEVSPTAQELREKSYINIVQGLYKRAPSGHLVVSIMKDMVIYNSREMKSLNLVKHPEFIVEGAELAQRAYYALYPLTASLEPADSGVLNDFVPGRGWGRAGSRS